MGTQGASILVIDAETDFAEQLAEALRDAHLTPLLAADATLGLEMARQRLPAAIVVCVELPRMSGYSVCTKIRKDEALKGIPVIITSSRATPETFESHSRLSTRADEYLKKPFPPAALVELLRPHVGDALGDGPIQVDGEEVDIVDDVLDAPATLGDDEAFSPDEVRSLDGGYEPAQTTAVNQVPVVSSPQRGGSAANFLLSPAALSGVAAESIDEAEALTSVGQLEAMATPPATVAARRTTSIAAGPSAAEAAGRRQLDSLRGELERAQASLEQAQRERDEALGQLDVAKSSQLPSAAPATRELLDLKRERNQKDKEILGLKQQLAEKERELLEWRDRESELEEKIATLTDEGARLEAARAGLESKLAAEARTAHQTIADLKRRLSESNAREADLDGTVQALQQDLDGARGAVEDLTRVEAELREVLTNTEERLANEQGRGAALEGDLASSQAELTRTTEERDRVRRELEQRTRDLDARLQELDARGRDLDTRNRELEVRTRELEQRTRERDDLDMALEAARAEAADREVRTTGEIDALTREVDRLIGESDRLTSDGERQAQEISRLGNELSAAAAEAQSLREQLRQSSAEVEAAQTENVRLEGVIAAERAEKEGLRGLIDEINAERERTEGHLNGAYQRIREDEAIRSKALQALEIAVALLKEAGYSSSATTAADGEPTTGVVRS